MRILEWIEAKNNVPKAPEWVCMNGKCKIKLEYIPGCKPMLSVFGPSTGMCSFGNIEFECVPDLIEWLQSVV